MTTEPIVTPAAVAAWWGIDPTLQSPAGGTRGACALWKFHNPGEPIEVEGEVDAGTHIVSVVAGGVSRQEYFGDGRLRFARDSRAGLLNIVPAGERPRAILSSANGDWSFFHIYLPSRVLVETVEQAELGVAPGEVELIDPCGAEDGEVWLASRLLLRELGGGGPLSRLRIDTLHQDIAIHLLRRHSTLVRHPALTRRNARGGLAPWQLRRATDAMEAHLGDDFGLDALAVIAGCSPTHFSRAFKQSTGIAPFQWLLERRIERAKDLLAQGGTSLAEVALAVGFAAQPQFTTAFKRATGTTPGAWRRERRA